MTGREYYYFAFLSPIILPIIIGFIEAIIPGIEISTYSGLVLMSLIIGGIPYLVFLGGLYFWMRNKNAKKIYRYSYIFPIIYLLISLLFLTLFIAYIHPEKLDDIDYLMGSFYFYGKFSVIFGYGYVLLINLVYGLMKISGKIITK